jgi:YVTN family beta-propeller protein
MDKAFMKEIAMKLFRLSRWLYAGLLFMLVACQPIMPPTAVPAAQATPAPTMASSPASEPVVGEIIATIAVGNTPGDVVAIGDGALWVPNVGDGTVSHIDAKTNEVVATIPIGTKGITSTYGSP